MLSPSPLSVYLIEAAPSARPTSQEIERYARAILMHEQRPADALPACREEAELQLWLANMPDRLRQKFWRMLSAA